MYKLVDVEQGTEPWHKLRAECIGSSDIAAIIGVSPWTSAYGLWKQKLDIGEEVKEHRGMLRGKEMEAEAREVFEEYTDKKFPPAVICSTIHPWALASLDGFNEGLGPVEIKCPNEKDHEIAGRGLVPDKYKPQCQWILMISGFKKMFYWSYRDKIGSAVLVEADEEYQQMLLKKAVEFREMLKTMTPPEDDGKTPLKREDSEWNDLENDYFFNIEAAKPYIEHAERAKEALKRLATENGSKVQEGMLVRASLTTRPGRVDYKKIPELHGIDLSPYKSEDKESYTITIKKTS